MLFRETSLPAKAMVPDYIEIASTWANAGVRQKQGMSLLHDSLCVTGHRTQSSV